MSQYSEGEWRWIQDEKEAWLPGKLVSPLTYEVEGRGKVKVTEAQDQELDMCGKLMDAHVENLVDLDVFSEGSILHHVRKRFHYDAGQGIYTFVGSILVACNPFERFPIYGKEYVDKYRNAAQLNDHMSPHSYAIAATSYERMRNSSKSQSTLISGESGAGKTETTKQVLQYLAAVAGSGKPGELGVAEQILQSNPVLEAFGNAKTLRNDNSSRFGKWMKIDFDVATMKIHGCSIINYLLEKSRVIAQNQQERNYHSFYQLICGATPEEKEEFNLQPILDYPFLNMSGCTEVNGVDDKKEQDDMRNAMDILQYSKEDQKACFQTLAAVLALSKVQFVPGSTEDSSATSPDSETFVADAARLLGMELEGLAGLKTVLTKKFEQIGGRGSTIEQFFTVAKAQETCHAFAKAIYGLMFDWLVRKVNETLFHGETKVHFGCLDIFGFETFDVNSFEQLCINFTNEKLQFHFNEVIFSEEMKLYEAEGVPSENISFQDNKPCVDLIEMRKPVPGILALLDEECKLGKGTDIGFLNKCDEKFGAKKGEEPYKNYFTKRPQDKETFKVQHFAGPVTYTVTNFLEKNKDTISKTLQEAAGASTSPLVALLFKPDPAEEAAASGGGKKKGGGKKTLGCKFKESLDSLMVALYATEPAFIRCVKSNHAKKPGRMDGDIVISQLRNGGLFEAIKIRRAGYGYRIPLNNFMRQYAVIYADLSAQSRKKGADARVVCEDLIQRFVKDNAGPEVIPSNFVMGKTKVFLKTIKEQNMLEKKRKDVLSGRVLKVQALARGFTYRLAKWREEHKAEEEERLAREKALREERMRLEGEKMRLKASIRIQGVARMRYAAKKVRTMNDTLALQKVEFSAEKSRDVTELRRVIDSFKAKVAADPVANSLLLVRVQRSEVRLAELVDQQELLEAIAEAMHNLDLDELAECLKRATQLKVTHLPEVRDAKDHWEGIQYKRSIMDRLTDFLRDDSVVEDVPTLVAEARDLGIKGDFLNHIETVYAEVAPRLEARNDLRKGVEFVDASLLREGLEKIRVFASEEKSYASKEVRAAEQLLRMLEFEDELIIPTDSGFAEAPRLTAELVVMCEFIQRAATPALKKEAENDLRTSLPNREAYERVVRAFKWRTVYCEWLYYKKESENWELPDDVAFSGNPEEDENDGNESFLGLNTHAARRLYSVTQADYVHGDEIPASLAGALTSGLKPRSKQFKPMTENKPRERPNRSRRIPVPRQARPKKERPKTAEERKLEESKKSLASKRKAAAKAHAEWSATMNEPKRLQQIKNTTRFK